MKKQILALLIVVMVMLTAVAQAETFNGLHATAFMDIKFNCGCTRYGTGTMIGRYGLVTAAHNLYCHIHGQGLKSCSFAFGSKSLNSAWYRYSGKFKYWAYDTFQNGYSSVNDIGYVIFDKAVGDETGWYGWLAGSDFDLNWESVSVYAYNNKAKLDGLFAQEEEVIDDSRVRLEGYLSGSEGGPIIVEYGGGGNGDSDLRVVAVYTSYDNSGNGYGRRITSNIISDMRAAGAFN